jgi:hypothetical protein
MEHTFTDEAQAHAVRRTMINQGRSVTLIGFDTARGVYAFNTMNRYRVTRQRVNCGPMQEIWVETIEEARRAYDIAVNAGDIFAEIFDGQEDCQLIWHLTPGRHVKY